MNEWNRNIVEAVRRIGGLAKSYKIMHMKATLWYRKRSYYANNFGLLGAAMAALIKGTQDYSDFDFLPEWLPEIGGVIAGSALLIIRMGRYDELVHLHKTTTGELASLIGNIERQLSLPIETRMPGVSYYEWVAKSYDTIVRSAEPIPSSIETAFRKFAIKRKLPIPDEYLLSDDFSDDSHIELTAMSLFKTPSSVDLEIGTTDPTPIVYPRDLSDVSDIEIEKEAESRSETGSDRDSEGSTSTNSSQLSYTNQIKGWGKLVRALGQYDETNMEHEMKQFQRICQHPARLSASNLARGTTQ